MTLWDSRTVERMANILERRTQKNEECQLFTGPTNQGYGHIIIKKQQKGIHRWAYMFYQRIEQLDTNVFIRHLCGNKLCVAEKHLERGTAGQNNHDKIEHGTGSKLSLNVVRQIKNSKGEGTPKERAERFDVAVKYVWCIDSGDTWAWVGATAADDNRAKMKPIPKRKFEQWTETDAENARAKIRAKTSHDTDTDCHTFTMGLDRNGYGKIGFLGVGYTSHKLSFLASGRIIPPGHHIRHKCKNKACCNIDHLETGTVTENALDRHRDGTIRAKISADIASQIKNSRGQGSQQERATQFGVTLPVVKTIDIGKRWAHIKSTLPPRVPQRRHPSIETARLIKNTSGTLNERARKFGFSQRVVFNIKHGVGRYKYL